jgi:hypothetical protein
MMFLASALYLIIGGVFAYRDAKLYRFPEEGSLTRVIMAAIYITLWPLWFLVRGIVRAWR